MKNLFLLMLLFSIMICSGQNKLINPILSGFYPDPSIIKVESDYYLVNSTFVYFPGIPVFHSKDLKNWKQIGNVIDRPSQMDFMGEQVSRGLFAPSINYHKGTYYVTCTDIDHGGNFIVTSKNPAGPWSSPVLLPQAKGIDPSLFFDKDKAYIIYNSDAPENKPLYSGHRTVRMYELDAENLKVKGAEVQLINGGVNLAEKPVWIEGPHIYKRDGYYYLLAAEGGTSVNHSQVAFKSKNVTGPYTPYEKNPILTQKHLKPDRKNPITSTGHADLLEGPDGKTYAVFLGVRPYEGDFYNTGRETFIAPVSWDSGWPIINPGQEEVQYSYNVTFPIRNTEKVTPQNSNFSYRLNFKNGLDPALLFLRTKDTTWYKTGKEGLTISLKPETCMETGNPAFIGKRQQHLICSASSEIEFNAASGNEKAGMMIFQNEHHFYYICRSIDHNRNPIVQLFKGNSQKKSMDLVKEKRLAVSTGKIFFKINALNNKYLFSYALKKDNWIDMAEAMDGKFLSTKAAGGFVGSLFAMYATSSGSPSTNTALYKWLDYSGNDEVYNK